VATVVSGRAAVLLNLSDFLGSLASDQGQRASAERGEC
jgi:hypothetical protein